MPHLFLFENFTETQKTWSKVWNQLKNLDYRTWIGLIQRFKLPKSEIENLPDLSSEKIYDIIQIVSHHIYSQDSETDHNKTDSNITI